MDVLFICYSFTKNMPTSQCLQAIVDEGVRLGHRCRIVSARGVVFDSKFSLEYKNSGDLGNDKVVGSRIEDVFRPLLRFFTWPGEPFEDVDSFSTAVEKEIEADCPDIIVCSVGAFHTICVGSRIKDKYPKIKYVPYFLDSILGGARLRLMPSFLHDHKALRWEERYMRNADSIIMMKYVEKKYKSLKHQPAYINRIKYLDLPLYNPSQIPSDSGRKYFPEDKINVFFAGSMPKRIRDPRFILRVFSKINRLDLNLYIAGTSDYQRDLESFAQKDSRVHLLGLIPHDTVLEMMNEADFLLSIGNQMDCMIPCKIFEYMSIGRPIISTYKRKTDPSLKYFYDYKSCLLLDESESVYAASSSFESYISSSSESTYQTDAASLYNNTPSAFWAYISISI